MRSSDGKREGAFLSKVSNRSTMTVCEGLAGTEANSFLPPCVSNRSNGGRAYSTILSHVNQFEVLGPRLRQRVGERPNLPPR